MKIRYLSVFLLLSGCGVSQYMRDDFTYVRVAGGQYEIATWQKITDKRAPIHIYIEGDGNAFDHWGMPTDNPTPRGRLVRDMAMRDRASNVVYMARPCQYIMSDACSVHDWTDGRFSSGIIESMANAVRSIADSRPVYLVGYSGGAMISGLIIERYPDINVKQWITVAGVLNHNDWTTYFGDSPLDASLDLDTLPRISSHHYVAESDTVVPNELSMRWTGGAMTVISGATHNNVGMFVPEFNQ